MDFNLAPLKYRNILATSGGPLERITVEQAGPQEELRYEAVAYLVPSLVPEWHKKSSIYSGGHGGGTHKLRNVACHIAISEALERWAFLQTLYGPAASQYGFDIEPSTSGMAAFPGFTSETARMRADWEAVERWALLAWWEGRLSAAERPDSDKNEGAISLSLPFKDKNAVVLWRALPGGNMAYGFAAADSEETALEKASVELGRNIVALNQFYGDRGADVRQFIADVELPVYERRLIFFSTAEGYEVFRARISSSTARMVAPREATKLIDREITGPWSRYATVWRTLYTQGAEHLDKARHDIFLF